MSAEPRTYPLLGPGAPETLVGYFIEGPAAGQKWAIPGAAPAVWELAKAPEAGWWVVEVDEPIVAPRGTYVRVGSHRNLHFYYWTGWNVA